MEELNSSGEANLSEEIGYKEAAVHSNGDVKHSITNGLSNGYDRDKEEKPNEKLQEKDKSRDKEKHREKDEKYRSKDGDKDRHRDKHKDHKDRDREKDKHREKDKERDKQRDKSKHSSSSSSKDKHSSSSSSKDKDRDKDRERKDREKEKSKHHDDKDRKDKEHKSSSSSSRDKEHKSSSSSSKHVSSSSSSKPSSSSSSKDKEHRDKDKERDKNRDKDKERSKDKHSSSSGRDKDKERHGSEKHKSDKDRHSSSSSKDKERDKHSPDKKDKPRDKDKEKSKDKEREKEVKKEMIEMKPGIAVPTIKEEREESFSFHNSTKEESMDEDDDGKLMIKEEPTDEEESKLDVTESSFDTSVIKREVKEEEDDEDDLPMAARMKRMLDSEDEDDVPLMARKKPKKESVKKRKKVESEDEEDDFKPAKKTKVKKEVKKEKKPVIKQETESPKKRKKKEEEEQEVWKWWEEEKKPDGVKWNFLEHKGPVFAPPYEPLPSSVKFYYDGEEMTLSEQAEEVATFYARMLDHDYTTKDAFNSNFMTDWRKMMTDKERAILKDLKKCNFKHMHAYFIKKSEERKAMSKEEKKAIKEENENITKEYGFCMIDGHKEKIGNFKIEPPGLFRGRGEHPKMGKLKRRVVSEDIIINCSKGSKVPPPPPGHRWKEVRHDNSVTWLASWTENVQGQVKYIMLNPSSKLKGEKDWQKYEIARKLAKSIQKIRDDYSADWKSKEMRIRQRAVAMYFIDKLALRAGNEKDEDQADTVGCCSLRVEHITLHEHKDGKDYVVVFDFLGKDSIRYYNEVPVEKRVFKNVTLFMENKKGEDDLFDRLTTQILNKHLSDLMEGLTAKVFRTYNASWTLQAQLKELTDPNASVAEKLLAYNRANRAVAILCNHQRAVPKTHDKSMANLREKLTTKRQQVEDAEKNYKHAKRDAKNGSAKERIAADKSKKTLERLKEQLLKLELQETDREENKTIALGTSKLNYLDPRISVAWCKKYDVPVDKIYNKTQRDKFRWAIDMATADYVF